LSMMTQRFFLVEFHEEQNGGDKWLWTTPKLRPNWPNVASTLFYHPHPPFVSKSPCILYRLRHLGPMLWFIKYIGKKLAK
jgi:hypothetical protein